MVVAVAFKMHVQKQSLVVKKEAGIGVQKTQQSKIHAERIHRHHGSRSCHRRGSWVLQWWW